MQPSIPKASKDSAAGSGTVNDKSSIKTVPLPKSAVPKDWTA